MVSISLKTKKYFIAHPDVCCPLLALGSIQLMTGEPRPPVQRAPVTWREWGLWEQPIVANFDDVMDCFHSFVKRACGGEFVHWIQPLTSFSALFSQILYCLEITSFINICISHCLQILSNILRLIGKYGVGIFHLPVGHVLKIDCEQSRGRTTNVPQKGLEQPHRRYATQVSDATTLCTCIIDTFEGRIKVSYDQNSNNIP